MSEVVQPKPKVIGFLSNDSPPIGAMLSPSFQQFLTMFPATILVAALTKFDVGMTLLASDLGSSVALLVAKRKIPMSTFSTQSSLRSAP
jgi:uracil permease